MRNNPLYLSDTYSSPSHHVLINNPAPSVEDPRCDRGKMNRRYHNDADSGGDWLGAWLGIIICVILFIFLIFVLSYPATYYYNGRDRNMNGIPDHREWNYYHNHGFWP